MDSFIELNNNVQIVGHKDLSNCCRSSQEEEKGERPRSKLNGNQHSRQNGSGAPSPAAHYLPTIDFKRQIEELRIAGQRLRSDADQPDLTKKPAWFEEELFENAKSVYGRHFMGINFAHLSGLLLLVRVSSIYKTLSATGKSDSVAKLFNRYYRTVLYVKRWYEGDIFDPTSEAHNSLLIVRSMHNQVCKNLNNNNVAQACKLAANISFQDQEQDMARTRSVQHHKLMEEKFESNADQADDGSTKADESVHISEYDIMLTQFAFIGFIVTRAKNVGLIDDFNGHDLKSLLHFWRVIGYYLGASEKFNLCSRELDEIEGICEAIMEAEFRRSIMRSPINSPPGIMGINIVRSIKFIPMLTIYGITKYLYELIDIDTSEIESRATRYSRLSYTLIKLVMSRLLAYKGFRWFNNGLTRLSVFLVGKLESSFANHLESKYGQNLRAYT